MNANYVRRCPSCGSENPPQRMRCSCGAMLAGLDLVSPTEPAPEPQTDSKPAAAVNPAASATTTAVTTSTALVCAHDDCGQANPPGSTLCLYCNRPLAQPSSSVSAPGLLRLPQALQARYHIVRALPTQGAEAELLLVQEGATGPHRVAKIYRHGIQPKAQVQQRLSQIDRAHRLDLLEFGQSDGHAFELLEYCPAGSLRDWLQEGPLDAAQCVHVTRELAQAIVAIHQAGLLHRDLKPGNVLIRQREPLDLVLTDFGISSLLDATQHLTGTARSLPYAAPESLSGLVDEKSDYWALGMILLEAVLGQHPFAGVSEAVILHHLTTRQMDLSGVGDLRLRLLLRGLLLRDPAQRWGAAQLGRWLAGDAQLSVPSETQSVARFNAPYHLGEAMCHSPDQLAVAMARDWDTAAHDLSNGQLQAWFREVQKDHNTVRLLLEMRFEKPVPVDVQLLRLILHLAPGIPPVFRGESVELPALLAKVGPALRGDADAAHWLRQVYEYQVLSTYARAGNAVMAEVAQKWDQAALDFNQSWDEAQKLLESHKAQMEARHYVNIDNLMFGAVSAPRPPLAQLHAPLLALCYDPAWVQRMRNKMQSELTGLLVHCPWLEGLGDPLTATKAQLLVMESLLPQARQAVAQHQQNQERDRQHEIQAGEDLRQSMLEVLASIRALAHRHLMLESQCSDARDTLDRYFEVLAKVKASGRSDEDWLSFKRVAGRPQRAVTEMLHLLDHLVERRTQNQGWFSQQVLGLIGLTVIIIPIGLGARAGYWVVAAVLALLGWRLLPNYWLMREIKTLAAGV